MWLPLSVESRYHPETGHHAPLSPIPSPLLSLLPSLLLLLLLLLLSSSSSLSLLLSLSLPLLLPVLFLLLELQLLVFLCRDLRPFLFDSLSFQPCRQCLKTFLFLIIVFAKYGQIILLILLLRHWQKMFIIFTQVASTINILQS